MHGDRVAVVDDAAVDVVERRRGVVGERRARLCLVVAGTAASGRDDQERQRGARELSSKQSGWSDSNRRLLRPKREHATRLRYTPYARQCRDELCRDDDDELPRAVDALDAVQLDVARRRRAGDEHDRPALARARLERRDQLGHRLDDRVGPDRRRRGGRGRGSAPGGPGPARRRGRSCPSRRTPAAQVVSAPSSASSSRGVEAVVLDELEPAGPQRRGRDPARRRPAGRRQRRTPRPPRAAGSSVTTTVAR